MRNALDILKSGTVIPANPLALDGNRQFDEAGQRLLTKYYLAAGCGGLAVGVHTTQFEIRLPQHNLFEKVLTCAIDEINKFESQTGKTIVKVAGVCGEIHQAVSEAELSKQLGYDVVLLSPGGLAHLSEQQLLERTRAVAKIIPVIGFYLQTAVGGRPLSFDYWKKISEIDNVVAIKCASFNRYQTLDLVRAVATSSRADEIALYTGNDDNIVVDLLTEYKFTIDGKTYEKRFVGGLLGHWSVWANNVVKMFVQIKAEAQKETISAEMLILANEVTDCNAVFFDAENNFAGCIAGLHEVLRRQGLMKNIYCLKPDETLSKGQFEEIDRIYKMYPHLNDDKFVRDFLNGNT